MKEINKESFTLNDLESGMVVETNTGKEYLVVSNLLLGTFGFNKLDSYNNDLTHQVSTCFDIIKVYQKSENWGRGLKGGIVHGELIWGK